MMPVSPWLVPALPIAAALLLGLVGDAAFGAWIAIAASGAAFAASLLLPGAQGAGVFLLVDGLSAHVAMLTAFVGFTTALYSRRYIAGAIGRGLLDATRAREYHVLFMFFLGFMLLALLSNNLGVTWVALEAATISAVLVVGLPRTATAIEAS